jgi:hypothetical protein
VVSFTIGSREVPGKGKICDKNNDNDDGDMQLILHSLLNSIGRVT